MFKRGKDLNNEDPNDDVARLLANIKVKLKEKYFQDKKNISSTCDTFYQRLGVTLVPTDCSNVAKTQMMKIPMRRSVNSWRR